MRGGERELERLARREAVERALRDRVSVEEGRLRNARDRWHDATARLAQARCGTRASLPHDQAERPLQWWQRD